MAEPTGPLRYWPTTHLRGDPRGDVELGRVLLRAVPRALRAHEAPAGLAPCTRRVGWVDEK